MKMTEAFVPSMILSEAYYPYLGTTGVIADAITQIIDEGFYGGVEIPCISDPPERSRIGHVIQENDIILMQWLTLWLATSELSLSSLDESLRRCTVQQIKEHMEFAAECGAQTIGVASGPDPGPDLRCQATNAFFDSLCELAAAGQTYGLRLVFEPLDRGADKNGLIGPTDEAVALMKRVREEFCNVALCWDTGHILLNGEELQASLSALQPFITNIHFSNAVFDREHPDFGDRHLPIGPPGVLTVDKIAQVLRSIIDSEVLAGNPPCAAIEIRTTPDADPLATWQLSKQTLQQAWNKVAATGDGE